MTDTEAVESYCQGFWGALERSGNAEYAALAQRFWEGMKGVKHDTETVEQMRDGLERLALETAGGWLNNNPEHALALVRLANEVRGSVSSSWPYNSIAGQTSYVPHPTTAVALLRERAQAMRKALVPLEFSQILDDAADDIEGKPRDVRRWEVVLRKETKP